MGKNRVVYYSKDDLATGHHLSLTENILDSFDENTAYEDINDILELASIRLYTSS